MNKRCILLIYALSFIFPAFIGAQQPHQLLSAGNLFEKGKELFHQKNYAAAQQQLEEFMNTGKSPELVQEAEYMLVCTSYELQDPNSITNLIAYLTKYPDTQHANRINALIASAYFFSDEFEESVRAFGKSELWRLENQERDDMTYRLAVAYMETGNLREAAILFETLSAFSKKYQEDATYYLAYLRYTQRDYDEALPGFLKLQTDKKYASLVPYYIADIYLAKRHYDKAEIVAQNHLSAWPGHEYSYEMHRILGEAYYYMQQYPRAISELTVYMNNTSSVKREAYYALGLAFFETGVYSRAAEMLLAATTTNDMITQNAYYHMGLAYLELADKNKARMAFSQAAAMNNDQTIKEQAAYNYALCIYDTSYSAFDESVNVFERFLNDFPNSQHRDKISNYLVEMYMNTKSYDAALRSIEKISTPGTKIREAQQQLLFKRGTQYFTNSNYSKATESFTQAIDMGQLNRNIRAEAYYWRGESWYKLNNPGNAERDFQAYLRETPDRNNELYALSYYNLGYLSFNAKNYSRALEYFNQYIQREKNKSVLTVTDALNRIGDCNFNARNFKAAEEYYAQAENMGNPSGDYSLYQLGLIQGLQKNYSGKIETLNRLINKYTNSPYVVQAMYEKGRAYVMLNNSTEAIGVFRSLMNNFPESPMSRKSANEIGLIYYQNGEYQQAISAYQYVVTKYPGSEEARLALRDLKSIYVDTNRVDEFIALTNSLPGNVHFDINEQDSLTYAAAERLYMNNNLNDAKTGFTRYLQSFPQGAYSPNAHYYLTVINYNEQNRQEALRHAAILQEYPDNKFSEEGLVIYAELLFSEKDYPNALIAYKRLNEKASSSERVVLAQTGIVRSAYAINDYAETIQAATQVLSSSKASPQIETEIRYYRAKSYLAENADGQAQKDLEEIAKDTRTTYGAESRYLVAETAYRSGDYSTAEKVLLGYIEESTPHAYWLAKSFILLADTYIATGKELEAKQYLLSLQQNYHAEDDIAGMIAIRLQNLNN